MQHREYWPPALIAQAVEQRLFGTRIECAFDTTKSKQIVLIPGMGAPVSQLFELVNSLRKEELFHEYGVTAVELGLSLGDFAKTFEGIIHKIENLISECHATQIVLYGHSHGGRFASELATYLQKEHPTIELCVITAGTPISQRPISIRNWLLSLSFRHWPDINQPHLKKFFALYSPADEIVDTQHTTAASQAELFELEGFSHNDFRRPSKVIPVLKKLLTTPNEMQ